MPYPSSRAVLRALRRRRSWVSAGGAALAAIAGFVNACLLSAFQVPVSHMTGAVSRLSRDVAAVNTADVGTVALLLLGFTAGAVVSGVVIGEAALRPGRRYGVVLMTEGAALALAAVLLPRSMPAGVALASFACGLQNAMASSYYGLILRTTHVTGLVTDLGVLLGQRLRGQRVPLWKPGVLGALVGGFFAGGVAGVAAVTRLGPAALALPAAACLLGGTAYLMWHHRQRRVATRAPRRLGSRLTGRARRRS